MKTFNLHFRVPVTLLARIDRLLKALRRIPNVLRKEYGGGTRSTVVRLSVEEGLELLEKKLAHELEGIDGTGKRKKKETV